MNELSKGIVLRGSRITAALMVLVMLAVLLPASALGAAATKLVITSTVPASRTSGQAISVTVEAQDGPGTIDTGFTGSVTFVTSDPAATVSPASGYTYTVADAGTKTFSVTLRSFGTQTFSFQSTGLTDTATKSVAVTASRVVFTTSPGGGVSATAWTTQPILEIRDETGAKVTTSTATVALAIGANPGGGILSGCSSPSLTAVAGVVTVTSCKIDKAGAGYTLVATSSGLTGDTSGGFSITAGAASKLAFTTQPARGIPTALFASQPVVAIEDAAGNIATSATATTITLAIGSNPGGGSLSGCSSLVTTSVASFSDCWINRVGVGYTLIATDTTGGGAPHPYSPATSAAFDVSDRVVFTTQPSGAVAGTAFTTQPVVAVRAGASNTAVNDSTTSVTLSLSGGPAGATLTGCTSNPLTVSAGVASFSGCRIDKVGTYTLIASATNLSSATSSSFTVVAGPAVKLGFTAQPTSATSNQAFPIQPIVAIQDAGGNTVTSAPATVVTLAIGSNPAGGTLTCTSGNTRTTVSGVATFADCAINNAGAGYTLTASGGVYTSVTSSSFNVTAPVAQITLTTSAPLITWGSGILLSVQFGTNGTGKTFQLQAARDGVSWATIATLTTDSFGRATLAYRPATNSYYQAVFLGAPDLQAANSATVRTVVRQKASLRPTNSGTIRVIRRGTSITFVTTIRPARPELPTPQALFRLYRRVSGVWLLVSERVVAANSVGQAVTTFRFSTRGSWYVRSRANPTPYNANSIWSPVERYDVR